MDLAKVLEEDVATLTPEEQLIWNLLRAELHTKQALDVLNKRDGPKRSLWYRTVLSYGHNILMSLGVRELGRKKKA